MHGFRFGTAALGALVFLTLAPGAVLADRGNGAFVDTTTTTVENDCHPETEPAGSITCMSFESRLHVVITPSGLLLQGQHTTTQGETTLDGAFVSEFSSINNSHVVTNPDFDPIFVSHGTAHGVFTNSEQSCTTTSVSHFVDGHEPRAHQSTHCRPVD